jgi:hypothetical protein
MIIKNFYINFGIFQNLAEEIENIFKKIGPEKFAAIVTDNTSNCAAAQTIISEKYSFIFSTHCIVHCVNLITKDVLDILLIKFTYLISYILILITHMINK